MGLALTARPPAAAALAFCCLGDRDKEHEETSDIVSLVGYEARCRCASVWKVCERQTTLTRTRNCESFMDYEEI